MRPVSTRKQFKVFIIALFCASLFSLNSPREANAEVVANGMMQLGIDEETTGIGRGMAGAMYSFGKFAVDAHIAFAAMTRLNSDKGTRANSITVLDIGARYAFMSKDFVGPYLSLGGGFGFFIGNPHNRKVIDAETCASRGTDDCAYNVDKNLSGRAGLGWGFQPFKNKATVIGIRLDLTYWMYSLNDRLDQSP